MLWTMFITVDLNTSAVIWLCDFIYEIDHDFDLSLVQYYVLSLIIQTIVHSIDDRSDIAEADTTNDLERFAYSTIQYQLGFTRLLWVELYNQSPCKILFTCPETVEIFDMDMSVNTSTFTLLGHRVLMLIACNLIDYIRRIRFSATSESSIHKFFSLWEIAHCDYC